jgi:hypothetical protein
MTYTDIQVRRSPFQPPWRPKEMSPSLREVGRYLRKQSLYSLFVMKLLSIEAAVRSSLADPISSRLLQPLPPARLVARRRCELEASGAGAGRKVEALAIESDRAPDPAL